MIDFIENNLTIKIEGEIYYLYESYIVNGTGYTFRIYKSSKHCQERDNCYIIGTGDDKIVIIGNKYNYLLIRNKDYKIFEFFITKHEKHNLRFVQEQNLYSIYLNENRLVSYYASDPIFEKEIEAYKKAYKKCVRREKLKKLKKNE